MTKGVAKILFAKANGDYGPDDVHSGMGIVLDARRILTCAHVVNSALDRTKEFAERPTGTIPVTFPFSGGSFKVSLATVALWLPRGSERSGDIAIIELAEAIPQDVGVATFAPANALKAGNAVQIYGVRAGEKHGQHANYVYSGPVDDKLDQLDGGAAAQASVAEGYSGAAVRIGNDEVVGMTVSRYAGGNLIAYMIRNTVLQAVIGADPGKPRKTATLVKLGAPLAGTDETVTGIKTDAITSFCKWVSSQAQIACQGQPLQSSKYAGFYEGSREERIYYIANPRSEFNENGIPSDADWPISYELFFKAAALAADGLAYEVSLIWDVDFDKTLFGSYRADDRMTEYWSRIAAQNDVKGNVDFVRVGYGNCLEVGFRRKLRPLGDAIEDIAETCGKGGASAADDVLTLMAIAEPVLTRVVLDYRRP